MLEHVFHASVVETTCSTSRKQHVSEVRRVLGFSKIWVVGFLKSVDQVQCPGSCIVLPRDSQLCSRVGGSEISDPGHQTETQVVRHGGQACPESGLPSNPDRTFRNRGCPKSWIEENLEFQEMLRTCLRRTPRAPVVATWLSVLLLHGCWSLPRAWTPPNLGSPS